jgi:hypothetical protein
MADDDHALLIDHDRLAKAELLDADGDRVHCGVVLARVARIGLDIVELPLLNVHGNLRVYCELFEPNRPEARA